MYWVTGCHIHWECQETLAMPCHLKTTCNTQISKVSQKAQKPYMIIPTTTTRLVWLVEEYVCMDWHEFHAATTVVQNSLKTCVMSEDSLIKLYAECI